MALGVQLKTGGKHLPYNRNVGDFLLPVTSGLLGQWFLGGSEEFSVKNRWSRGGYGDGQAYGTPIYEAYYGKFKSGTNGIFLSFPDPVAGTIYAVVRNTDTLADSAHRPNFIGSSPGSAGANIFYNSTSTTSNIYTSDGNIGSTNTTADSTRWHMLALKYDASLIKLFNLTEGDAATGTAVSGTRIQAPKNLAIGAYSGTSTTGTFDMAYCGIFNRFTTTDEDTAIYTKIKAMMADRGIAI